MENISSFKELKSPDFMAKNMPLKPQRLTNWFVFFLACPVLSILGNSVTFIIFIFLVLSVGKYWKRNYKGKLLFLSFFWIGVVSTILSPVNRDLDSLKWVLTMVQYIYWIYVAIFFLLFRDRIDLIQLSKWCFYGSIFYTIAFYLIPFDYSSAFLSLEFKPGRNAFVFNLLCSVPISFFYIRSRWKMLGVYSFMVIFLMIMLLSNGRSGSIIILIQMFLILAILKPEFHKISKVMVLLSLGLFGFLQLSNVQQSLEALSYQVEKINPRLATLMRSEGEGDLTMDKSWLIRELMIEKGKEIVQEYPFIGIGPNNFKYYKSELKVLSNSDKFNHLQSVSSKKLAEGTSAHNTYLQAITEFGIIGCVIYLILLLKPLIFLLKKYVNNGLGYEHLLLVSLIGMCIHFYTVANLSGALPWFIIGLSWSFLQPLKRIP